uniref:proline racemase family protein n=1 Tax=Candidatus Planktophila sp. TaxID=2175601 RepID=UPI004048F7F2
MREIRTVDYHTAGEPFRIVAKPPVEIVGDTVANRRVYAMASAEVDGLRKLLCFEPRGHADMYGCFITPPDDDGADFGVLFWHKDGFSTACGHGTIALGVWAIESGKVAIDPSGVTDVVIDVPSGRVTARVHTKGAVIESVDFVNVASYHMHSDVSVDTSLGALTVDVSFGGAIYAQLDVAQIGLSVTPERYGEIIAIGREIKWALNDSEYAEHPTDPRLSGIYGTIVYEDLATGTDGLKRQRNATIFADGEVDRSPCGSGTCARLATLVEKKQLKIGEVLKHDSIVDSQFLGVAKAQVTSDGYDAILPQVTGMAYKTGESVFTVDPRDPLSPGFVLR